MYGSDALFVIVSIIITISGILAIFIPFWIFRIRNEIIKTNKLLARLIELNGGINPDHYIIDSSTKPTKQCPKCGKANKKTDSTCIYCGTNLRNIL
ncbi:MAG: zinc-ribbon domain-containing protein [Proteobacteria bacterium]|nr:zinc-ribbon domain-containing protein [Pseudomonadota bacterium]